MIYLLSSLLDDSANVTSQNGDQQVSQHQLVIEADSVVLSEGLYNFYSSGSLNQSLPNDSVYFEPIGSSISNFSIDDSNEYELVSYTTGSSNYATLKINYIEFFENNRNIAKRSLIYFKKVDYKNGIYLFYDDSDNLFYTISGNLAVLEWSNINFNYYRKIYSSSSGPQGLQGPTGSQGPQGFQGPIGITGSTGPQGFQGLQGPTGSQGPQGFQGPIGITGSTGPQGFQGLQGPTGSQGPQGFQGFQGPIGITGSQGFQGLQGPTGSQGPQGFQGPIGITGSQGPQGNDGSSGTQGYQGPTGSNGSAGAQGPTGTFTFFAQSVVGYTCPNDNVVNVAASIYIPANTLAVGDRIKVVNRTTSGGTQVKNIRHYLNTTNAITGSPGQPNNQTNSTSATILTGVILVARGASSVDFYGVSGAGSGYPTATVAIVNKAFNLNADLYILITMQKNTAPYTDTWVLDEYYVQQLKA